MNKIQLKRIAMILCLLLAGCQSEANYRGVPKGAWQQLTPEQKQLIVDQSFATEFNTEKRS